MVIKGIRNYISLVLLFLPAVGFGVFVFYAEQMGKLTVWPWEFSLLVVLGIVATTGGILDWLYHRNPLNLKLSTKERDSEAAALFVGGVPLFGLMWLASFLSQPSRVLIPILVFALLCTTLICYDEFVFHRKRCGLRETIYHRMLVFGNGMAWLAWMNWIYG